jgi:hypothetical protein
MHKTLIVFEKSYKLLHKKIKILLHPVQADKDCKNIVTSTLIYQKDVF